MTELRFEKKIIKGAHLNGQSAMPAMKCYESGTENTKLDEDDELFVGYGKLKNILPYQMQDKYDRCEDDIEFDTAVLENEYLKAVFIPSLGGRLWSLFDKEHKKDLVTDNPVFRPCNLALRNAWLCGGVEWNIGMIGHSPFTCSPLFTARLEAEDGTPVLRMYEFERVRRAVYQMDFFLPEKSHFMFARMRIVNPNSETVPMYWWSNIAVPENEGSRVIAPADTKFNFDYVYRALVKDKIKDYKDGFDSTYPTNNPIAIDYFFNLRKDSRKFETQLDKSGYGLIQTSTARLQGRKLFVWGQGQGGKHWQKFLTNEKGHPYQEMQAGIAKTQTECLPMPPKTAWEWLEAYGAMQADPEKVHGDWDEAIKTVGEKIDTMLPENVLDDLLESTKKDFVFKKGELVSSGSGWGALENERRIAAGLEKMCPHLDFGDIKEEQKPWIALLKDGVLPDTSEPVSYMIQDEWFDMLKAADDKSNAQTKLQLGINYYAREDYERAKKYFKKSLDIEKSAFAYYGLGNTYHMMGNKEKASKYMVKASMMRPDDASLAKETLVILAENEEYDSILTLIDNIDDSIKAGKIEYFYALAIAHKGRFDEAEHILLDNGGLLVPDMKEGEVSTSDLYVYIQKEKAKLKGNDLKTEDIKVPFDLDFRMNVEG